MRAYALLLGFSLALAAQAAEARPMRVASLNLCTDELLLALADDSQIASVTHLSKQRAETPYWERGLRFPTNDGSLLSVVSLKPDLVLIYAKAGDALVLVRLGSHSELFG